MGLIGDIFRGFGLGLGLNVANDVYDAAKDVVTGKDQPTAVQNTTISNNDNEKSQNAK